MFLRDNRRLPSLLPVTVRCLDLAAIALVYPFVRSLVPDYEIIHRLGPWSQIMLTIVFRRWPAKGHVKRTQ